MSLRRKTLLILGITIVAMIVVLFAASQLVLRYRHGVKVAEDAESRRNLDRAVAAIDEALDELDRMLLDRANNDEMYECVGSGDAACVEGRFPDETMAGFRLNFALCIDPEGSLVFQKGFDLASNRPHPLSQDQLEELARIESALGDGEGTGSGESGILILQGAPVLVSSRPILDSRSEGPARGTLVVGRRLDDDETARLAQTSGLTLAAERVGDRAAPSDFHLAWGVWSAGHQYVILRLSRETIAGYTVLEDLTEQPALIVRVEMPRTAYLQARASTTRLFWLVLTVGLALGTVTLLFLEKLVLFPVSHLIKTVIEIGQSGNLSARVRLSGRDELSVLGAEINKMLGSLEQTEAELIRQSKQIQMLIENQGEGVVIVDRLERFTFANPAACEIFGVEPATLIDRRLGDFVEPEGLKAIREYKKECRKYGKSTYEFDIVVESGDRRTILATATPRRDDKGGFIGTFEVFRDITERKRTERLEASLAVKSEFLSMVSHELRTPLVPIMGYAELLLSGTFGDLPEVFVEPLETIYSRAQSLRNLIDDILQLNRMEHGTLGVRLEDVKVRSLVEEVVRPYMEIDQTKPTTIKVACDEISVQADPDRLRQVLQNLIGNSMKYSRDEVEITITAVAAEGVGRISVTDNGIGIPKDELPFIFERFYQIESINTRKHEGAGLGLAIAKELVERMGGGIGVESEPGKGSTFTVTLPSTGEAGREVTAEMSAGAVSETEEEHDGEVEEERRVSILVIDDDSFSVNLLKKILEDTYDVQVAGTGGEGLDIIHRSKVDLVLLDWLMPGMDGLSLLISLKSDEATRDIPVIFVSGLTEPESMEKGLEAGAVGFIAKPYNKDEIVEAIEATIHDAGVTTESS